MSIEGRFCPICGTKRTGFFRFCNKCGFDYDVLGRIPPVSSAVAPGQVALSETPAAPIETPAAPAQTPAHRSIFDIVRTLRPAPVPDDEGRSRERLFVRIAIVALAGLLGISALSNALNPRRSPGTAEPSTAIGSPLVVESPGTGGGPDASFVAATFEPAGRTTFGVVIDVIDGDTIVVDIDGEDHTVRYIGIDAPALDAGDPTVRGWAEAAKEANSSLVKDREVYVEQDVSDTDTGGRLLRAVWFVGTGGALELVNLELVERGFAIVLPGGPDQRYEALLRQAEDGAKTAAVGLWSGAEASPGSSPAVTQPSP